MNTVVSKSIYCSSENSHITLSKFISHAVCWSLFLGCLSGWIKELCRPVSHSVSTKRMSDICLGTQSLAIEPWQQSSNCHLHNTLSSCPTAATAVAFASIPFHERPCNPLCNLCSLLRFANFLFQVSPPCSPWRHRHPA